MKRKEILPPPKEKRRGANKLRKPKDRAELKTRLLAWRADAHSQDYLAVRPYSYILDDKAIKLLSTLHPTNIRSSEQLVLALNETEEWNQEFSTKILAIIHTYDQELEDLRKTSITEGKAQQKRRKTEMDLASFRADTERRLQDSAAQGFSRFVNTR